MQSGDCLGAEDPHGDFLRHDRFALACKGGIEAARAAVEVEPVAKPFVIVAGAPCRQCAVRGAGRGRDDRESEKRHVVLLRQANRGGGGLQGRLECAMERGQRHFEVYDVLGCGLDRITLENGVLRVRAQVNE